MELKDWRARRAGGQITVSGTDTTTNAEAKIVGVDYMEPGRPGAGFVLAVDKSSNSHRLLVPFA